MLGERCPICGERHCFHTWEEMQVKYQELREQAEAKVEGLERENKQLRERLKTAEIDGAHKATTVFNAIEGLESEVLWKAIDPNGECEHVSDLMVRCAELNRARQERDYLLEQKERVRARMNKIAGLPEDGLWYAALQACEKLRDERDEARGLLRDIDRDIVQRACKTYRLDDADFAMLEIARVAREKYRERIDALLNEK